MLTRYDREIVTRMNVNPLPTSHAVQMDGRIETNRTQQDTKLYFNKRFSADDVNETDRFLFFRAPSPPPPILFLIDTVCP